MAHDTGFLWWYALSAMATHLFISYVSEDRRYFDDLERHLRPLHAQGRITYWHMGMVPAGKDWRAWRRRHMDQAQVILCLLSADYLAQAQQEIEEISQRQRAGAQVLPVLVRPALLDGTPFEALQPLPPGGIPISLRRNQDNVILDVIKGLMGVLTKPAVAEQAVAPTIPAMAGQGQTSGQPSATPPVGVIYETQKPMPSPVPATSPSIDSSGAKVSVNVEIRWDIFISHAGPDSEAAVQLHKQLAAAGLRVFTDKLSLLLGDDWAVEIPRAQKQSRITVVLLSPRCDRAYYEREEIAAAIALARDERYVHRVVPIFLEGFPADPGDMPFGLRSKHGLSAPNVGGISGVAESLRELHTRIVTKS